MQTMCLLKDRIFPRFCKIRTKAFVKCDTGWRRIFSAYCTDSCCAECPGRKKSSYQQTAIVCSWLSSQLLIAYVIGEEGMFEPDITFAINTLMVLSICMSILYFRCLMVRVLMLGFKDLTLLLPPAEPLQMLKVVLKWSSAVKYFENYAKEGKRNRAKKHHQGCAFWISRVKWSSCEQKLL